MATTCRVQLALYDSLCPSQQLSPFENKIGGFPDFFPSCVLDSPPTCKCCGASLALLVQVYCPHDGSPYHRLLHVYCCHQNVCWSKSKSWLVLRSQQRDPSYDTEKKVVVKSPMVVKPAVNQAAASEWCEDLDDWGDSDGVGENGPECVVLDLSDKSVRDARVEIEEGESTQQVEDRMKALTVEETFVESNGTPSVGVVATQSYRGPYYLAAFISVVEEPETSAFEAEKLLKKYKIENHATMEIETGWNEKKVRDSGRHQRRKPGRHGDTTSVGGEAYEKGLARHGDKTFQKFHKQLSKVPQQILRYSWKGMPLLFSSAPAHLPPKESALVCKECGAPCVFELQLMPPLVYILEQYGVKGLQRANGQDLLPSLERAVEFGTVLVYSCSASCWEGAHAVFREETVVVQPDSDTVDKLKLP